MHDCFKCVFAFSLFAGDVSGIGGGLSGGKETAQTSMHENLVESYQNVINKCTIATTGNCTDFGDMRVARSKHGGLSGA